MELKRAVKAGFCSGVKRALTIVEKKLTQKGAKKVFILGSLIHNPQVNQSLAERGLKTVSSLEETEEGILVLPSHGVSPQLRAEAEKKGLEVLDATCPHVSRVQKLAQELTLAGYQVVILGEAEHAEVQGIWGYTEGKGIIVGKVDDLAQNLWEKKIGVVVQTTQNPAQLKELVGELSIRAQEMQVHNTICNATRERQQAAAQLAKEVDLMIVIGGYNSANTRRLTEICQQEGPVYHIEKLADLAFPCLEGVAKVGITAGASTPQWLIEEIEEKILSWGEER